MSLGWIIMGIAIPKEGKPLRKWNVKLYMLGSRLHDIQTKRNHR